MEENKNLEVLEEATVETFEEIEEVVTAAWTGCASCCN